MSPDLERQLVDKYPVLFVDYGSDPSQSGMALGFECGDGWFDLLDALCAQLEALDPVEITGEVQPLRAEQVKENSDPCAFIFGLTRPRRGLTALAASISSKTCETCGNKGLIRGMRRVKTLCDACAENTALINQSAR